MDYLPGGEDDMSYLIKRVVFRLHDTYPTPNRSEYQISLFGCRASVPSVLDEIVGY